MTAHSTAPRDATRAAALQYVTVRIGPQMFGLPIAMVHEVFAPEAVTRVPLAPAEIAGVLNLRGRIVTMVALRRLLGLPPQEGAAMAVGIEHHGETFGLVIDKVGEVLALDASTREANPANLDPRWAQVAAGVHRLDRELMLILNVELVLERAGSAITRQAAAPGEER